MHGSFFPDKFEITREIEEKLIFGELFTPVLGKSAMSVVLISPVLRKSKLQLIIFGATYLLL